MCPFDIPCLFSLTAGLTVDCLQCYQCNARKQQYCMYNFTIPEINYRNCSVKEQYCMVRFAAIFPGVLKKIIIVVIANGVVLRTL